jgi:hypothetical protein
MSRQLDTNKWLRHQTIPLSKNTGISTAVQKCVERNEDYAKERCALISLLFVKNVYVCGFHPNVFCAYCKTEMCAA